MTAVVRSAKTSDVKKIRAIIDTYAVERKLLSKETVTLFESVQEFIVAEVDGEVVGCGALHVLWEDIAEVRTVAVVGKMHGKGIGHLILESILAKAKEVGVKKVFCLTFETSIGRSLCFVLISNKVVVLGTDTGYGWPPRFNIAARFSRRIRSCSGRSSSSAMMC